jgi:hypothetical protein
VMRMVLPVMFTWLFSCLDWTLRHHAGTQLWQSQEIKA